MSIIYDALQKIQQDQDEVPKAPIKLKTHKRKLKMALMVTGGILFLILFSFVFYLLFVQVKSVTHTLYARYLNHPAPHVNLQLTGVFFANEKQLAMINNHLLTVGDNIDGLRLVEIQEGGVRLQDGDHNVLLRLDS